MCQTIHNTKKMQSTLLFPALAVTLVCWLVLNHKKTYHLLTTFDTQQHLSNSKPLVGSGTFLWCWAFMRWKTKQHILSQNFTRLRRLLLSTDVPDNYNIVVGLLQREYSCIVGDSTAPSPLFESLSEVRSRHILYTWGKLSWQVKTKNTKYRELYNILNPFQSRWEALL